MPLKATNNFVFIKRDLADEEVNGVWLPEQVRKKPSQGTIISVGDLVKDKNIKSSTGKKCLFHAGVGFHIPFQGEEYLVLTGDEIIGLP